MKYVRLIALMDCIVFGLLFAQEDQNPATYALLAWFGALLIRELGWVQFSERWPGVGVRLATITALLSIAVLIKLLQDFPGWRSCQRGGLGYVLWVSMLISAWSTSKEGLLRLKEEEGR